jgi:transposase
MSSKIDLRLELQACKMNCVDPLDWFSHILTRIPQGWPAAKIEALMPRNLRPDAIG